MSKKKQNNEENLTEEEIFGYYFIAGYTPGGMPYGITMAEAEEQGLLDDENEESNPVPKTNEEPIDENTLPF